MAGRRGPSGTDAAGALALATAVSLLAAACTFGPLAGEGGRTPAPQRPRPRVGGTLTVAIPEPDTLDPSRASTNRSALLVLRQICEPLVSADPSTGALKPGAAKSWVVAPDGRKVTFTLRQGLKFANGREVAAGDYVFSLSRFVQMSPQHLLLDRIAGYPEVRSGAAGELAGVKAPDPRILEVELAEPFAELPAVLTHPGAGSAVAKEEVEARGEGFPGAPVCTGAYTLAAPWAAGQDLRLVRSAGFDGKNPAFSRGGAGYADEIVFKPIPDLDAGYRMLEEGAVQVAEVPLSKLTQARGVEGRVESASSGLLSYVGFPLTKAPFDNPNLRRALSLAIDRRALVEDLLAGSRQAAAGFLPPSAGPAWSQNVCSETMKPTADAAEAKTALQAAGIDPAATKLTIYFNDSGSGHEVWLQKVGEQWKGALGIDSVLQPGEWKAYLDFLVEGGADGPFRLAWPVDYPSPEAILGPLFTTGSLDNYTRFTSPEFDDLVNRARATPDEAARRSLYLEAGALLCRELPVAPTWFGQSHIAFHSSVAAEGPRRVDVFGYPLLKELGTAT